MHAEYLFRGGGALLTLFVINLFKTNSRKTIRLSISLDLDQDECSVGPGLGPNCLQTSSRPSHGKTNECIMRDP